MAVEALDIDDDIAVSKASTAIICYGVSVCRSFEWKLWNTGRN